MKILHVITRSDLGGAQSVVIALANSMCKKHTIMVAAGENGPMWDALDLEIKKEKIPQNRKTYINSKRYYCSYKA